MIRTVLVPLDGSPFGENALPLAASVVRAAGGRLAVVRVHEFLPPAYGVNPALAGRVDEVVKEQEREYLAGLTRRLPADVAGGVSVELLEGDVVDTLAARAADADLVVMTTHGRGPLARFWLGGVTDELMRVVPVPLILIHPGHAPTDLPGEPAVRLILVALDGTPQAEEILEPAAELAALTRASIKLVRAVRPLLLGTYPADADPSKEQVHTLLDDLVEEQRLQEADARAYLSAVAGRLTTGGLTVETGVLTDAQPAVAILREAETSGAGLIALATRCPHGLPRLLFGSVADKVVRASSVPVLLRRQSGAKDERGGARRGP